MLRFNIRDHLFFFRPILGEKRLKHACVRVCSTKYLFVALENMSYFINKVILYVVRVLVFNCICNYMYISSRKKQVLK